MGGGHTSPATSTPPIPPDHKEAFLPLFKAFLNRIHQNVRKQGLAWDRVAEVVGETLAENIQLLRKRKKLRNFVANSSFVAFYALFMNVILISENFRWK